MVRKYTSATPARKSRTNASKTRSQRRSEYRMRKLIDSIMEVVKSGNQMSAEMHTQVVLNRKLIGEMSDVLSTAFVSYQLAQLANDPNMTFRT